MAQDMKKAELAEFAFTVKDWDIASSWAEPLNSNS